MSIAEQLVGEYEKIKGRRGTWEQHWQEIAKKILPRYDNFIDHMITPGEKKTEEIFDSTGLLALERFAAAMESILVPRNQTWHKLQSTNKDLNDDSEVKEWFDEVNTILFSERYSPRANFASQYHENIMQLGAFGTGCVFTDEALTGGLRYKSIHLAELFFAENHQGVVDKVYRKFKLTAHQANGIPEWEARLPEKIKKAQNPFQEFEFLHVVAKRDDFDPNRADFKGMQYASWYISFEGKQLLSEGGYNRMPYAVSRYVTGPNEVYGRSPAMMVLPDIKMINEMSKTDIRAVHKLIDPPLLLHDDGLMGAGSMGVNIRPGGLNYGGVSMDGRQLIQPLSTGARVDINEAKMEQRRETINDAFLVTLFQILVDSPQMTATEVLTRMQEKGALLGPAGGRQQSESLGPMIEREVDILQRQGKLPELPGLLLEAEGEYEIRYESPLNRMQRAEEVVGISRTLEIATPFLQVKPELIEVFDDEEIIRIAAEVNGMPNKALKTRDEYQRVLEGIQEQQAEQRQVENAQPAATALKDVASAQAMLREPAA